MNILLTEKDSRRTWNKRSIDDFNTLGLFSHKAANRKEADALLGLHIKVRPWYCDIPMAKKGGIYKGIRS